MKEYLVNTFRYNDTANRRLLGKILQLPDPTQGVKYLSHLIHSQNKWMARITGAANAQELDWWEPVYPHDELEAAWQQSVERWIDYVESHSEAELSTEVTYTGFDGTLFAATPQDIALQLNYHSIHHRAQVQTMIRAQGLEPDFLDYIGTKYRRM